jgi:hypothetical protein
MKATRTDRRRRWLSRGDIARLLAEQCESLVAELVPVGRRHGNVYRAASIDGGEGQSFCVFLSGHRRGKWKEFAGVEEYGDLLDLVIRQRGNGDFAKGMDWAHAWLGIFSWPEEERQSRQERGRRREERALRVAARSSAEKGERALEIWDRRSRPLRPDDLVIGYCLGRGIRLVEDLGRAPTALRFAPELWAAPGRYLPAMVALVTDGAGEPTGIHRTFLERRPDGSIGKASGLGEDAVKRCLGPCQGGSIKLWRGASGASWRELADNETVLLSEGIEDLLSALTIAEVCLTEKTRHGYRQRVVRARELRAVCGMSLSFMAVIDFPPQIKRVIILQQRDPKGSKPEQGLPKVIERLRQQRRQVLLMPSPAWTGLKDINDFARRLA